VPVFLIVLAFVALVCVIIWLAYVAEKKRTEEFQAVANDLGFEFVPKGDPNLLQSMGRFRLFSQGHSKQIKNLLRSKTEELKVAIFDYKFTTGSGKNSHTWSQSVISFCFPGAPLPKFLMRPEGFWDKIGSWMGFQDIDFDDHPEFSSNYVLRGDNEQAVRQLFTSAILDYFTENKKLCTEGCGQTLLFYRSQVRVKPQEVRKFLEEGWRVLALFHPVE